MTSSVMKMTIVMMTMIENITRQNTFHSLRSFECGSVRGVVTDQDLGN